MSSDLSLKAAPGDDARSACGKPRSLRRVLGVVIVAVLAFALLPTGQALADPPVNITKPSISGTPSPGSMLHCDPGTWTGNPTFSYEWLRNGGGFGSGQDWQVAADTDAGDVIICRVDATNDDGMTSETAFVEVPGAPSTTPTPTPTPTPTQGDKAGAPTLRMRIYRQNLAKVIKSGLYVYISMDKAGSFNAQLLLDNAALKRMKLRLKGGVVTTAKAMTPTGGGGKSFFMKFKGAALAALKRELKLKRSVKITVAVTGADKSKHAAKKLVKSYTLRSGASA